MSRGPLDDLGPLNDLGPCEAGGGPGGGRPMRRLLMVANAFPPMASGGNARQLRFIRYLPEFGWEVTVLSARAHGPTPVPEGVRVERAAAPNPESLYGLARRATGLARRASSLAGRTRRLMQARRGTPATVPPAGGAAADAATAAACATATTPGSASPATIAGVAAPPRGKQRRFSRRGALNDWLFVPDEYAGWIVPAVRLGRRLLESERYDAILSSFPRPSTEVIASRLARDSGLPWLADYRDPWATRHLRHYPTALHRKAHYALEDWALRPVTAVTATNQPIADSLLQRFPPLRGRVRVLPNGFDPFEEPADVEPLGDGFWLVHTGRLYGRSDQLQRVLHAFAALPPDVKLLFVGIEGAQVRDAAEQLGVAARVRTVPFVPHAVALGYQHQADGLVLITGNAPEALSSKVFEYLVAGRPIFAFVPQGSAAHQLLSESGGAVCAPQDEPPDEYLARFVEQTRAGTIPPPDATVVARFDGRELTRRLAGYLDRIVDQSRGLPRRPGRWRSNGAGRRGGRRNGAARRDGRRTGSRTQRQAGRDGKAGAPRERSRGCAVSAGALQPSEARRGFAAADLPLLALAVAATLALTWALIRGEWDRLALAVAVAVVVALVLSRTRLARLRLHAVFGTLAVVVPMLSIMGATVSVPGARALFGARLLLGLLALLGIVRIALGPVSLTLGPRGLRTMLVLWFAWMTVTLLWAPDPRAGLGYLLTVLLMMAVTLIVAACAARPRYLALLLWLLAAALALTLIVAAAELVTGRHLPGSAALLQTLPGVAPGRKATTWFVNTNDLASYLAICWPFLLLGALAARNGWRRLVLAAALLASGGVVIYTGSRTSLITMFLETLVAGYLAVRHGWLSGKRALAAILAVVVLLSGMGVLAFNNADLPFIRQFRVAGLAEDIEAGTGSGDVRLDLARAGLSTANRYFYAGVGPGNAEALVKQTGEVSVAFGNLHSWWFEVFVNSGLPGAVLFAVFFFGLIAVTGRALRRTRCGADSWLAAATFTALVGWIIGAFGPSTAVSFAPMWVLFGLGLAVAVRGQQTGDGLRTGADRLPAVANAVTSRGGSGSPVAANAVTSQHGAGTGDGTDASDGAAAGAPSRPNVQEAGP